MSIPVIQLHSPIELLVSRPAPAVGPDTPLGETAALMVAEGVSAVLVDSQPLGIVTERDVVTAMVVGQSWECPTAEVAATVSVTVGADTDIIEAAEVMLQRQLRHLVVRVGKRPYAIVAISEIAAALVQAATAGHWMGSLSLGIDLDVMTGMASWP